MPEYRYGETILYRTEDVDADGRVFLTRRPPKAEVWVIDGVEYMSIRDAAEISGFHDQTIRQREWDGRLESLRVRGRIYIPLDAVRRLILE